MIVVFSGRRIVRGRRLFALPALDGEVVDGQVHVIVANAVSLLTHFEEAAARRGQAERRRLRRAAVETVGPKGWFSA